MRRTGAGSTIAGRCSKGDALEAEPDEMAEDLTDSQIALLCDIEEHVLSDASVDKKRDLERLVSDGYARQTHGDPGSAFKLTAKGLDFLSKRGAGLNEG
jgi:hypothetical protein